MAASVNPRPGLQWGPPSSMVRQPIVMANGDTLSTPSVTADRGHGPGATMPAGSYYGAGMRQPSSLRTMQDQAAQQNGPVQISPGVYVWPNGQPLTAAEVQALNLQNVVSQAPTTSAELTAQEATAATTTAATTAATTSWLDENTITANYTNGQVVLAGAAAVALFWFLKKR